ncbi:hypothetical protein N781_12180 [Pontibacillus halophilus JSM 076056 = DSM 19796]|uniref:Flagellar protein FlbD n=1 Tax=Pontibacillus halophilus JSM 076056 = DSM 19796 TaxID=1385510 RepID=A0A0A5GIS8_9BACI|nr:flagellar FlbD family protein [Pontibacillus halophilus]KGX93166.1 hypothetical protein N781_12180 [Pontibacillus halophilus JSM 076056 = DSM 19796]
MISLTRLNGQSVTVNAIYIEMVESLPDTTITLSNGRKYFVTETEDEVTRLVKQFYRQVGLVGVRADVEGSS